MKRRLRVPPRGQQSLYSMFDPSNSRQSSALRPIKRKGQATITDMAGVVRVEDFLSIKDRLSNGLAHGEPKTILRALKECEDVRWSFEAVTTTGIGEVIGEVRRKAKLRVKTAIDAWEEAKSKNKTSGLKDPLTDPELLEWAKVATHARKIKKTVTETLAKTAKFTREPGGPGFDAAFYAESSKHRKK